MRLPSRLTWAGSKCESTFADLKQAQGGLATDYLTSLLQAVGQAQRSSPQKRLPGQQAPGLSKLLKRPSERHNFQKSNLIAKVRLRPGALTASLRREVELASFTQFKRMKTVFCHADHSTDEVSSIFNVQFDRTGRFIISGADDGILKVWDRDSLTLQASLHGHFDFITDIDVSKCNRFVASAGKDALVIIWDLKLGKIIKRLTDHQNLINRLIFVAPNVKSASSSNAERSQDSVQRSLETLRAFGATRGAGDAGQAGQEAEVGGAPASFPVKDQFLLTCSDDGTVHLYDFSPFSRADWNSRDSQRSSSRGQQAATEYDELRMRRSGRRSAAEQNGHGPGGPDGAAQQDEEPYIFDVALIPDDYRPGTRNKKLDVVACNATGIVVAGSSTGEVFCWRLDFAEIARRNKNDSYKYLGQFKICKNAGVQFAEFSPIGDLLMTGSTDGSVKIWRFDLPIAKQARLQALKTFSMADESRLVVTIDEKVGCIKTNSIAYFDEEGNEKFEYQPVKQPVSGYVTKQASGKEAVNFSKSQCDAIKWSVQGRYAIASITSQIEDSTAILPEEFKDEVCRIKIWDTHNETFYDDLARPSGHQLKKNSWVLAPHPIFEELLMTGSDGGTLILWNLELKQIIQQFSQYGVYSIDGYVRDNPLDGRFSSDGKAFIVGNQLGTISLFSCEPIEHQYEATRVQQFFQYDRERCSRNPFERIENRPEICGYNMIPHQSQPGKPLIGKFASDELATADPVGAQQVAEDSHMEDGQVDKTPEQALAQKQADSKAFERKLLTAKELGLLEEKYYQHQLQNCLQESYQPNVLDQGNQQLDAFAESSIEPLNGGGNGEAAYEDQSLVNALSPPRQASRVANGSRGGAPDFSTPATSENVRSRVRASSGQRRQVGHSAQRGRRNRRLVRQTDRTLQDHPEIDGFDSDQLIQDGYAQSPQSLYNDESAEEDLDEESASDASDIDSQPERQRQRFQVRRANVHDRVRPNQDAQEAEQRNQRQARHARRAAVVNDEDSDEDSEVAITSAVVNTSRRVFPQSAQSGDAQDSSVINIDMLDEDEIEPPVRRGRGRPTNAERERRRVYEERLRQQQRLQNNLQVGQPSSRNGSTRRRNQSDISMSNDGADQDSMIGFATSTRRTRLRQTDTRQNSGSERRTSLRGAANLSASSPEASRQQPNSGNRRLRRRVVDNSETSRQEDLEESKGGSPDKGEKDHNQVIRESGFFLSDREEASAFNFDQVSQANDRGDESPSRARKSMKEPDPPGSQSDEDYNLIQDPQKLSTLDQLPESQRTKACAFCQKSDEVLIGPFCKYEDKDETKLIGAPLHFHQDCIELNLFSKFSTERKKWVNIGKALQNLVHKEQFSCYRCQTKGATVQCRDCGKAFHGFRCARMYTIQLSEEESGQVFYQCVFCRNGQNWEDRVSELTDKEPERRQLEHEGLLHEKEYLKQLAAIDKEHLLSAKSYASCLKEAARSGMRSFVPQVNDFVYYFFQGHEYYMTQHSLHFFCGQQEKFSRQRFMPYLKTPRLRKREFVRCRVETIEILFPSQRSLNLIEMYGSDCTQVTQQPQIIQRLTLAVVENSAPSNSSVRFQVDLFPSSLPDFLVPQGLFTEKYERYVKALQEGMTGKTYDVYLKEQNTVKQMRIVSGNAPLEPTLYDKSLWLNIRCVEASPGRSGRVNEMPQHRSIRQRQDQQMAGPASIEEVGEEDCERVSFWDVSFGGADELKAVGSAMQVFAAEEKAKLVNTLKDFFEKKREFVECFMERVPVAVAPDYRSIIPADMYFDLIRKRVENGYYRTQEQLLSDIDLVSYNARIYNGEEHDIAVNAKELCEIIRVKLKQAMFTKSDTLMQQQIAYAGKLTAPSRTRTILQQKTLMDEARNRLTEDQTSSLPTAAAMPAEVQPQVVQEPASTTQIVTTSEGQLNAMNGSNVRSLEVSDGVQPREEETKKVIEATGGSTGLVRINLNAPQETPVQKQALANRAIIIESTQDGDTQKLVESVPAAAAATAKGQKTTDSSVMSNGGKVVARQAQTASSNMGRRRNRINANLLASEDLEQTTKGEAASLVQAEASTPNAANQNGVSSSAVVVVVDSKGDSKGDEQPAATTENKRVTRNNLRNKRQRQE